MKGQFHEIIFDFMSTFFHLCMDANILLLVQLVYQCQVCLTLMLDLIVYLDTAIFILSENVLGQFAYVCSELDVCVCVCLCVCVCVSFLYVTITLSNFIIVQ